MEKAYKNVFTGIYLSHSFSKLVLHTQIEASTVLNNNMYLNFYTDLLEI